MSACRFALVTERRHAKIAKVEAMLFGKGSVVSNRTSAARHSIPTSRTTEGWEIGCRDCTTFNWKGVRIASSGLAADLRTFTVNPEIAANFCNARCPRGISAIMTGRFPRSRLRAWQELRFHRLTNKQPQRTINPIALSKYAAAHAPCSM